MNLKSHSSTVLSILDNIFPFLKALWKWAFGFMICSNAFVLLKGHEKQLCCFPGNKDISDYMRRMQHQFFSVEEVGKFLHEKKNLFFLSQVIFSNKNCKSWSLNFAEKFLVKRDAKTIFFSKNKRMARIYFVIYKERKKIGNFLVEKYCSNSTKIKEGIHFFMYSTTTLLLQAMST